MSTVTVDERQTPSREELVQRARDLAPVFAERAAAAEDARRLPEESISDMVLAGFPRTLVPREFGGYEFGAQTWFDVEREIGKGDASHAWCASLMIHHAHYVSLFPEAAQRAVWNDGPDTVVSASIVPAAEVTPVKGGYRISGSARYASGITGASWVIIGGLVRGEGTPQWTWFLVGPDDYEVEDSWFTSGMRGTGSNTVVTDDVFVPTDRALRQSAIREGTTPGAELHARALYRAPWSSFAPLTFVGPMLGAATAAYEQLTAWAASRHAETGQSIADFAHVQVKLGRTAAALDAAELLLRRAAEVVDAGGITDRLRTRAVRDFSFAAELITEAIDTVMGLSGSAGFAISNPIQRAWRDIHFAASHHGLNPELNFAYWGQGELGLAPNPLTY
jgi:3-hydroxy-9,10-secoandrosta-1,3,5(10)-triene-9,17-dione monooxygenase